MSEVELAVEDRANGSMKLDKGERRYIASVVTIPFAVVFGAALAGWLSQGRQITTLEKDMATLTQIQIATSQDLADASKELDDWKTEFRGRLENLAQNVQGTRETVVRLEERTRTPDKR